MKIAFQRITYYWRPWSSHLSCLLVIFWNYNFSFSDINILAFCKKNSPDLKLKDSQTYILLFVIRSYAFWSCIFTAWTTIRRTNKCSSASSSVCTLGSSGWATTLQCEFYLPCRKFKNSTSKHLETHINSFNSIKFTHISHSILLAFTQHIHVHIKFHTHWYDFMTTDEHDRLLNL